MNSTRHDMARPPTIVLGGADNALSIARNLGRAGIETYAISFPPALVKYSRFARWIDTPRVPGPVEDSWAAYLLGPESNHLRGAVLLAACDEAIDLILKHREALSGKFRLDLSNPAAQRCMLNKLCTYEAARKAGVPTPRFWIADSREQVESLQSELVFPLIVKPLLSHEYKATFSGAPFACVRRFDELLATFEKLSRARIKMFLVEMIPGPDDRLCSYYTYLDEKGDNLFDFTKRIIRRLPMNLGPGVYHITDRVPDVRELSLKLFRQVELRGIANAEFKLDTRDGQLKLIECNARFTAADCLLAASGLNLSLFVYKRLTGDPQPAPKTYRVGLRLWYPYSDYLAYRQLRGLGMLTLGQWVRSILHPQVFAVFVWYDPRPAIVNAARRVKSWTAARLRR